LTLKAVASGQGPADNNRFAFIRQVESAVNKTLIVLSVAWATAASAVAAAQPPQREGEGLEFFEKRIRPLFAENCYQCHGPKKQESGLVLSTVGGLRKGGDRGTPLALGEPDSSLLIQAVRYTDDDLKMPPRGKLKDEQIADLVAWVKLGAPLPTDDEPKLAVVRPSSEFNLAERRTHWAYQPVQHVPLPLAGTKLGPVVLPDAWCQEPIDSFILARLQAAGLEPSAPAAKQSLIRRLTFDLTGLPPLPEEVSAFVADDAPDTYQRLVDRLLATPRYGERFGRHWLDVVRYSETLGFEFDYDLHNAWRYRDYVIRAFNYDLPYDQFVIEHLAGDLLPQARRHPIDGTNESILATGFWWMHEGKQTPVDIRQDQADRIDNQLDVLGKAFLGQTIACARCHDHKFDAISTRDYYALAGYLRSSRYQQAFIDPLEAMRSKLDELTALRASLQLSIRKPVAELWKTQASLVAHYLLAAAKEREDASLDAERLKLWTKALRDESLSAVDHPLFGWWRRTKPEPASIAEIKTALGQQKDEAEHRFTSDDVFEDFGSRSFRRWFVTGNAFSSGPAKPGQIVLGNDAARPIARLTSGGADSGAISNRLQGELRSQSFTVGKKIRPFASGRSQCSGQSGHRRLHADHEPDVWQVDRRANKRQPDLAHDSGRSLGRASGVH